MVFLVDTQRLLSVWVSYPLKQGLKQSSFEIRAFPCLLVWVSYPLKQGLKLHFDFFHFPFSPVWVSYPLKQGLKRSTDAANISGHWLVWVSYPLKQGLKPTIFSIIVSPFSVWVSYPLKQGLKLRGYNNVCWGFEVWVSYPLKQGLKLIIAAVVPNCRESLSQLSIKTRIETNTLLFQCVTPFLFESAIH